MSKRTTPVYVGTDTTPSGYITSTSNERERDLIAYDNLPDDVRADFDYMERDDRYDDRMLPRFVYAYGAWYDTDDTDGLAPDALKAQGWNTYASDSVWTGVVFRHFDRDGEYLEGVVVGRYVAHDHR